MSTPEELEAIEREIQRFKLKKLIQNLDSARGNGTSMITLMLTPKDTIPRMVSLLTDEQGTAMNIKNHVNKVSVLTAITSVMQRLKLFTRVPPNGLVIYSGTIITEDNKEKKITIDMEPFKPVARTMYMCDNKFHTEPLASMLESDDKFGFIVMDGSGTLFGILQGSTREVLHKLTVELPKKHGRGGQSALRFARLRMEKRHNYLRKVAELTTQLFITNDRPNVAGLVLAGSADFKTDLCQSDLFDGRLQPIVLKVVDVAYGGENGFNQAVELAGDVLAGVRFVQEKKLITRFFNEISTDTSRFVYGVDDTWRALEMGAVQTLIIWEALPHVRFTVTPAGGGEPNVYVVPAADALDQKKLVDAATGTPLEVEKESFVEWLATNYRKYGCTLEFVSNKSHEGNQFCRGFGGIGGLLRYQVDFAQLRRAEEAAEAAAHTSGDGEGGGAGAVQKPVEFMDEDFI